jgi:hypothetical protein
MTECFKCKKELAISGINSVCRCMDCKFYFCFEEGRVLDERVLTKIIRGINDRMICDFLCSDCEFNRNNREKAIKEHNEKITKAREERERAEMLKAQMLHSSKNLNAEYDETEKLPEIWKVNNLINGFQGEFRPCSVYTELYGSKWPSIDTKIYLTFTHYKQSGSYGEKPIETTEYYCLLCSKRFFINQLRDLERNFLINRRSRTFKEKFPDIEFDKN